MLRRQARPGATGEARPGTGLPGGCGSSQAHSGFTAWRRRPCSPGGGRSGPASGARTGAAAHRQARLQQRWLVLSAQDWLSHGSGSQKDLEPRARPGAAWDRGPEVCPAVVFRSSISRAVFHWGCLGRGRGIRKPKPWAVSGKRAPCDWGRETFTRPGALLRVPEPSALSSCYVSSRLLRTAASFRAPMPTGKG